MANKLSRFKRAVSAPGRAIEKLHNSRAVRAVDKFMYKPVRRIPASIVASGLSGIAGGAGAVGTFFGKGETFMQKVGDAVIAIPKGVVNTFRHYVNAPEYLRNANEALEYVREAGPEVANELRYAGTNLETGVRLAQRGVNELRQGMDYLVPGGSDFDLIEGYNTLRVARNTLEGAKQTIEQGGSQFQETAGPVADALREIDLNPIIHALYNFADNMAPDEFWKTLSVAAGSVAVGWSAAQYFGGFWGRRGMPSILSLSRHVQRRGVRRFPDFYADHPEKIAGEAGVKAYGNHLLRNPEKLEKLVRDAGYVMVPQDLKEEGEGE